MAHGYSELRKVNEEPKRFCPARVLLTNGEWYVLFLDPADAFLDGGVRAPHHILVLVSPSDLEDRFQDVYLHLEYSRDLGETPPIRAEQVGFFLDGSSVVRAMHGLLLRYSATPGVHQPDVPAIVVAPVVFLKNINGSWLCVFAGNDYSMPPKGDHLSEHLAEVDNAAIELLTKINQVLGTEVTPSGLTEHYQTNDVTSGALRGVREQCEDSFVLVTGAATHYLKQAPSVSECKWHDFGEARVAGVGSDTGVFRRSTKPRSFFYSREEHHCAHTGVRSAKLTVIDQINRQRCGPRSSEDGAAFCEISAFESHLCCRACVFEEVCVSSGVFSLPCE